MAHRACVQAVVPIVKALRGALDTWDLKLDEVLSVMAVTVV